MIIIRREKSLLSPPIEPMWATPVADLFEPRTAGTPQYEVKFDGWRCVAYVAGPRVRLQSRQLRDLTRHFPDVAAHLGAARLPEAVLDGELIVFDPATGRTSFGALQRRVAAGPGLRAETSARPASYVVFDLLCFDGVTLLDRPLLERRALLEQLCAGLPWLLVCPATRDPDEARAWFDDYAATGAEGIVIKDLSGRYRPGAPGWWKWKRRTTTEAVIGGVAGSLRAPAALLLGRFAADGRLRFVGRSTALAADQRAELAGLLAPAADEPWPQPLPATWGFDRRDRTPYVAVAPRLIAEIAVDEAFEHGRWRHPVRFLRLRTDLRPAELPVWTPDSVPVGAAGDR